MPYKVFLVEDEIVTREGIRDNVNWEASGFQFCGEASDGEMALPLLDTTRPDVLITDIRMPFMDGLQLSKIVRERMPGVKIVILSGHDEFEYAQAAIKLGVTEYLLKPVSVQDLQGVLGRVSAQIEREQKEQAELRSLQSQVAESREALRESLFLKLVMGTVSAAEAIEQGNALGIDLIARWYLVAIVQAERSDAGQTGRDRCKRIQDIVTTVAGNNPDVFLLKKGVAENVLILKGHIPEYLQEEADYLLSLIRQRAQEGGCEPTTGMGTPKLHLRDLYHSFVEALCDVHTQSDGDTQSDGHSDGNRPGGSTEADRTELLKVDKLAVDNYLRYGVKEELDDFFATFVRRLDLAVQRSPLIKNYLLMDIVVAAARFVHELGGDIGEVVPNLGAIEEMLTVIQTVDEIKEPARRILLNALAFRDSHSNEPYAAMMRQVKQYLAHHYGDPELSLQEVARQINLSPSHFSMVFGQEAGTTFKSYLTEIRIARAKEMLRATSLRPSEISLQVGYNDPHYFSYVFRKHTGLTPTDFRAQPQAGLAQESG
jgi:two-component system, response regulator YesN